MGKILLGNQNPGWERFRWGRLAGNGRIVPTTYQPATKGANTMAQQPAKRLIGLFMILLLLGAAACTSTTVDQIPVRETPTAMPEPTETAVEILADCFQSATALAWLDENGDGLWDEGEPPLPGIEFVLEPTVYSRTTSDENGVANIFATTPGGTCSENQQVIAVKFAGYALTTANSLDYIDANTDYVFGFQPLPAATLIDTDSYSGAIFSADKTAEFITWLDEPADSFWTPTEEDIANFEDGLAAFLQENSSEYNDTTNILENLSEYKRQYFGLVRADEALVLANFFCGTHGEDWGETAVIVDDGGDCYFQVIFNADANTFVSLSINGES
jgi:hypothetical protein